MGPKDRWQDVGMDDECLHGGIDVATDVENVPIRVHDPIFVKVLWYLDLLHLIDPKFAHSNGINLLSIVCLAIPGEIKWKILFKQC